MLLLGAACTSTHRSDTAAQHEIAVDRAYIPDPADTPFEGELRFAARWDDDAGSHALLISGSEPYPAAHGNTRLYVKLYDLRKQPALVFETQENVMGMGCDRNIDLPQKRIHIQDLDAGGLAEAMFCFSLNNRCDAVPVDARLLMLSKGKPFWIREYAQQYLGPPQHVVDQRAKEEGKQPYLLSDPDKAMTNAHKGIREFAFREWESWVMEEE